MKMNKYKFCIAEVIAIFTILRTEIGATLQTSKHHVQHERNILCHVSDSCQPPMLAFNQNRRGRNLSRIEHQKSQTFLNLGNDNYAQNETTNNIISSITQKIASSKQTWGRATLLVVSLLYGTLNVTLRAIYASDGAPSASVLSFVRQCLSVLTFIPIIASTKRGNLSENDTTEISRIHTDNTNVDEDGGSRSMWLAAAELAFWNFGAQGLINAGLLFSPAARASFLTQTSVVMTPLISAMAGEKIQSSVWGGCGLALVGLFLISTSSVDSTSATASSLNQGDVMILLGALSWSAYIFRTSQIADKHSELDLQFTKTVFLAGMYGIWFLSTALKSDGLLHLWPGFQSIPVWILLAYSAIGPGAIADLLQQQGQKEVSASESNIILCMESIFAAICAFALLGEVSSMKEVIGGLFIVAAAILASK